MKPLKLGEDVIIVGSSDWKIFEKIADQPEIDLEAFR